MGDDNGYGRGDGDDAEADAVREAIQANDGWMRKVADWGHIRFDLVTSVVDRYESKDGVNADTDGKEEVLQANDGSTQNVEDWRHSTRMCED